MCLDRLHIGNFGLKDRIEKALDMTKDGLMILQADGYPMSGGEDDYNDSRSACAPHPDWFDLVIPRVMELHRAHWAQHAAGGGGTGKGTLRGR